MKKAYLIFLIITIIFSSCKKDDCGCTYPYTLGINNSWQLNFTEINGNKLASSKKEIIIFDATNKVKTSYEKIVDNTVVESTNVDNINPLSSETKEMIITMTIDKIIYNQKFKLVYDNQNISTSLLSTKRITNSEDFGDYIYHYDLVKKGN